MNKINYAVTVVYYSKYDVSETQPDVILKNLANRKNELIIPH